MTMAVPSAGKKGRLLMQESVIYLASDHAGCVLRGLVYAHLEVRGHNLIDLGTDGDVSTGVGGAIVETASEAESGAAWSITSPAGPHFWLNST